MRGFLNKKYGQILGLWDIAVTNWKTHHGALYVLQNNGNYRTILQTTWKWVVPAARNSQVYPMIYWELTMPEDDWIMQKVPIVSEWKVRWNTWQVCWNLEQRLCRDWDLVERSRSLQSDDTVNMCLWLVELAHKCPLHGCSASWRLASSSSKACLWSPAQIIQPWHIAY